jgi:hypothetical protein
MAAPLPPRMSHFADPIGDVVWAAVSMLSKGEQQVLYAQLRDHLGDRLLTENQVSARAHRAIEGLRHAAELLGHSPSIREYRHMRETCPEERLPSDRAVRSALGSGAWNDCLRQARLDSVADGDVIVVNCGVQLTPAECIAALHACAEEIGSVPSATLYSAWAARPDVRRRPGRRPISTNPIVRLFGSFGNGIVAAGLLSDSARATVLPNGVVRAYGWKTTDEQVKAAMAEVCERVGRVPRSTEYGHVRAQIIAESLATGQPRTIPAVPTLLRLYGSWNKTLAAFGMEPFSGRSNLKPFVPREHNQRLTVFSEEEMLFAIREAGAASGKGAALTLQDYILWRGQEMDRTPAKGGAARRLPAPETIRAHLGTWTRARMLAFDQTR